MDNLARSLGIEVMGPLLSAILKCVERTSSLKLIDDHCNGCFVGNRLVLLVIFCLFVSLFFQWNIFSDLHFKKQTRHSCGIFRGTRFVMSSVSEQENKNFFIPRYSWVR